MKSFIFCTSFIRNDSQDHYSHRYKRWINYYYPLLDSFDASRLFLIDDGGTDTSESVNVLCDPLPNELTDAVNMYRFNIHIGKNSSIDFPGWWRSFLFSIEIARKYGYKKIIHIESDFFVLSLRLKQFIRDSNQGWTSLYSHFYNFPETGIQIICEDVFDKFDELKDKLQLNSFRSDELAEYVIPFTNIKKDFIGDRIGEVNVLARWMDNYVHQLSELDYIGQMNVPAEEQ